MIQVTGKENWNLNREVEGGMEPPCSCPAPSLQLSPAEGQVEGLHELTAARHPKHLPGPPGSLLKGVPSHFPPAVLSRPLYGETGLF